MDEQVDRMKAYEARIKALREVAAKYPVGSIERIAADEHVRRVMVDPRAVDPLRLHQITTIQGGVPDRHVVKVA